MTSDFAFECLLVSRDPSVVGIMNKQLENLSISTNVCLSTSRAVDHLSEGSTDLVVVDWDDDSAALLHEIRKSGRWQKPTVVAVSGQNSPVQGVHVAVHKPVTVASAAKSLKAAYSRMLYDYRRHARHALMSSVQATGENNRLLDVTITDIGDGGVGLSSRQELAIGDALSFHLLLPGTGRPIFIEARIQWARNYGSAGCEYVRIPPVDLNILSDWLQSKSQIKKPLVEI
jgi:hypothetical protein